MILRVSRCAAELRRDICERNAALAVSQRIAHVQSYGEEPVTVYAPQADGRGHGNFYAPSYRAILTRQPWARRLEKVHSNARRSLPRAERGWRELDSCTSSDALLMNIFCCPGVCRNISVSRLLGTEAGDMPVFGYRARVPLSPRQSAAGISAGREKGAKLRFDRTEVDMRLGELLVESKLTESDFQSAPESLVTDYGDLEEVFETGSLPRRGGRYLSYQLIRNVLAAYSGGLSFCVMLDARRPDLLEDWHLVLRCVSPVELRTRCKVLTWQELSVVLPPGLQKFLKAKYGIAPI